MNLSIPRRRDIMVHQIISTSVRDKELFLSYLSSVSYVTITVLSLPIDLTAMFSAVALASVAQHLKSNKAPYLDANN
jgi:hypothetical protein